MLRSSASASLPASHLCTLQFFLFLWFPNFPGSESIPSEEESPPKAPLPQWWHSLPLQGGGVLRPLDGKGTRWSWSRTLIQAGEHFQDLSRVDYRPNLSRASLPRLLFQAATVNLLPGSIILWARKAMFRCSGPSGGSYSSFFLSKTADSTLKSHRFAYTCLSTLQLHNHQCWGLQYNKRMLTICCVLASGYDVSGRSVYPCSRPSSDALGEAMDTQSWRCGLINIILISLIYAFVIFNLCPKESSREDREHQGRQWENLILMKWVKCGFWA